VVRGPITLMLVVILCRIWVQDSFGKMFGGMGQGAGNSYCVAMLIGHSTHFARHLPVCQSDDDNAV